MAYNDNWVWDGWIMCGASITALKKLGNKKGYSLVATCMSDAIFVRNDLAQTIFKNTNDEYELVKLNTDIHTVNKNFATHILKNHNIQFGQHLFDSTDIFSPSSTFL
jgi:hypothetical protein